MSWRILNSAAAAILIAWCARSNAAAAAEIAAPRDDVEARYLDGLRERRLFALAEAYCAHRWDDKQLSVTNRGRLAVEWIRTLTSHALNTPPDGRAELSRQSHQVAGRFAALHGEHSQVLLVRTQEALADYALGELARQEAEVDPTATTALDAALTTSRQAVRSLEQLDKQLTQLLPTRFRRTAAPDELTTDELTGLQHQLRLHAARALRNMALCYPADADDRLATLNRGLQLLDKSLQQVPDDEPLAPWLRLEQAAALRLLEKFDPAHEALGRIDTARWSDDVQIAVRTEQARGLVAEKRPDMALRVLEEGPANAERNSGEYAFVTLEATVARWQSAVASNKSEEAVEWQQRATEQLHRIERDQGPYWRHRGDLLLVRAAGKGGPINLDILSRTADRLYRQGQWDEAVAAYDQSAAKATQSGDAPAAFSCAYKAAIVQQERKRHDEAARRLRDLAVEHPEQRDAAEAHLQAIWNLAQILRQPDHETDEALSRRYTDWLEDQLKRWPRGETADQARSWLGVFRQEKGDWQGALDALRQISPDSPLYETALNGAARAWRELVEQARASSQPTTSLNADAARYFTAVVFGESGIPPDAWTAAHRGAALAAAQFELALAPEGYPRAERVLRAALDHADDADETWIAEARTLLVVALAGQPGRESDAREVLRAAAGATGTSLLAILASLRQLARESPAAHRAALARLRLDAVERLQADASPRTPAQRTAIERARAEALADSGDRAAALDAFRKLVAAAPADGESHERLADLLLNGPDAAQWREALVEWRKIAARSQPRTPRWFRAKAGVAAAQIKLGEKAAAAQLIRFLMETPPGLAGTPYENQFEQLLRASRR